MSDTFFEAATLIIPLVFAIVFHEIAHGLMARTLGDPTASERGRLTLNPLKHVDPIGTVVLPGMLALAHLPVFGWAKPVPVIAARMRNPRVGMMLTAAAGPGMNLIMALLTAVLIGLMVRAYGDQSPTGVGLFVFKNLVNFIQINVFLALFNLLPIPPFDGSHIVEGLLPRALARGFGKLRNLGFALALIVLVVLPQVMPGLDIVGRVVGPPFEWTLDRLGSVIEAVSGQQASPEKVV